MQKSPNKPGQIVKLRVVRSFREKQQRAQLRKDFKACAEALAEYPDIAGYVVVAIKEDGDCDALFDCGPVAPAALPAHIQAMLQKAVKQAAEEQEAP